MRRDLEIDVRPLRGGLVSQVARVTARPSGAGSAFEAVVKELRGVAARELDVYRLAPDLAMAPRLLGQLERGGATYLLLEAVERGHPWPWSDAAAPARVLGRLAALHDGSAPAPLAAALASWDYDAELRARGAAALELLEQGREAPGLAPLRPHLPALRRTVQALPKIRSELAAELPPALLHGDVHTGNVLERDTGDVVFVDWERARIGSPLEDVSSWLQSLGYWEPVAKQRHDTLLRGYLDARGIVRALGPSLRAAYWLAGASNALAGALLLHLYQARDERDPGRRDAAAARARDWLRIVRRADACWATAPTAPRAVTPLAAEGDRRPRTPRASEAATIVRP